MLKSIAAATLLGALVFGSSFTGKLSTDLKVNTAKSNLHWFATKVTGKHDGTVKLSAGTIKTDGKTVTGGSFDVDMSTLVVLDITDKETNGKLLGHLMSDDFFSAAKHKTAHFDISKVVSKGGANYDVTGDLTIKGIKNEVTFPATITASAKSVTAKAKITLDRTKWDIKYGSGKFFEGLGDKVIHDDFVIELDLVAGS
jgi:polyisoprenoid-binding protein YceI